MGGLGLRQAPRRDIGFNMAGKRAAVDQLQYQALAAVRVFPKPDYRGGFCSAWAASWCRWMSSTAAQDRAQARRASRAECLVELVVGQVGAVDQP